MFIFNYKKYEFKLVIDNNLNLSMIIYKNTLTDKISMSKIVLNVNDSIIPEKIEDNLDLKIEENEKKFLSYVGSYLAIFIRNLLDKDKSAVEFNLEKNKVKILATMEKDKYNLGVYLTSNNPKTSFNLMINKNEFVDIKVNAYNKLLDEFSKDGDLEKFEHSINADFVNNIQKLFRYIYNIKKDFNDKKQKEDKLNLVSSEYEETLNNKNKLKEEKLKLSSELIEIKDKIKDLENKLILYKIGSGLSVVFLIVIIILFFKRR